MDSFAYRDGELFCEDVAVDAIAAQTGTPVYVYSAQTLLDHYRKVESAFADLSPTICFSIKSLANLSVLKLLAVAGSGFDVVSGGEVARAKAIGADMSKVVFAGVGKSDAELREALAAGVGVFNVESEAEFENLSRIAAAEGATPRAALRVNPDVYDPKTHTYTTTGKKETKFGVDIDRAVRFFQTYAADANVRLDGIHIHLGSPIYSAEPYVQAIGKTLELIDRLAEMDCPVRLVDLGGGFAADYEPGRSPDAMAYAEAIVPMLAGRGLEVVLEPGRSIAANAGILLTRIQYVKTGGDRTFLIADAAMTDLLRPTLYQAEHFMWPAQLPSGSQAPSRQINDDVPDGQLVDVVGGVCETGDFLARGRMLPAMRRGQLLAVFSAGAYGFVMSSQYNSRPRSPEVLVERDTWRVVRPRESYADLFACEQDCLDG